MIDAGHGGYDGGTVAEDGTTEKDLTLALALETGKQLKKLNPEIKVVYTRTNDKVTWSEDETEDLKARVKMAKKEKEVKTNAMRILEKLKIPFEVKTYECDEFVDGMHIADQLGQPYAQSFKTLVMQGKSKEYYVILKFNGVKSKLRILSVSQSFIGSNSETYRIGLMCSNDLHI